MCLNPTWASSNNSVFLCSRCAFLHKSLGDNISIVKSLEVSDWSDREIILLRIGGNKRFSSLMEEYKIPNRIIKYKTRIGHYYRKVLALEASFIEGKDLDDQYQQLLQSKPHIENGSELVESSSQEDILNECEPPAHTVHEGVKEDLAKIGKTVGGIFNWIGGAFQTTAQKIGIDKKIIETKEEISKIEVNPNIKEAGNKVYEAMKYSTEFVSNKVKETEAYKTMTFRVDQGYITLKQKIQDIVKPFKFKGESDISKDNDINKTNDNSHSNMNVSSNIDNNVMNNNKINNDSPPLKLENAPPGFLDINKSDY